MAGGQRWCEGPSRSTGPHSSSNYDALLPSLGGGFYLDPTDASGSSPSPFPSPGPWWPFPSAVELAYANEPGAGSARGGPNCCVEDGNVGDAELLFVTARDIAAGEEILIDYGQHYDRSGYQAP